MTRKACIILFLPTFLLLAVFSAPVAHAVQSSGSISLFPTDWGRLETGDVIDVIVTVNNTSSDTPATDFPSDGVDPVPAELNGNITVLLSCQDPDCMSQASGRLAFVPVGGSGCVSKNGAVQSCMAAGANAVLISLKSNGITLPAGGSVDVATIRLEVVDSTNLVQLGLKAMSDAGAIQACSSSTSSVCAECDATGCTTLLFGPSNVPISCPHACPARIIFRGDAATPDFFEFHGLIEVGAGGIDPPGESFVISLSNANFDPIFSFTVPPGSFVQQGTTFTYRNNAARNAGGVAFVKLSARNGLPTTYKIDIQAFDAALESRATLPTMTVSFSIGDDAFTTTNDWTPKPNGWFLNLPK